MGINNQLPKIIDIYFGPFKEAAEEETEYVGHRCVGSVSSSLGGGERGGGGGA